MDVIDPATTSRLAWPDFARGLSIILVVLLHLFLLHYIYFFYGSEGSELVNIVVDASLPLRMPLFFLVSGFLAARAIWRPWASISRARVWTFVYLYILWVLLNALFDMTRAALGRGGPIDPLRFIGENLIWPQTALWYLYALLLFFLATRLTRSIPLSIVVAAGVAVSIIGTTFFDGLPQHLLRSFVFYVLAARAPQLIDWVVARAGLGPMLATAATYAGLTALYLVTSIDFGVFLVAGAAGVILGIQIAVRVGSKRLATPIRYLGRHTLAIFLIHPFVFIVANDYFLRFPEAADALRDLPVVMALYPWALLAATLGLCVGLEAIAKRVGLGFLFVLPTWRSKLPR